MHRPCVGKFAELFREGYVSAGVALDEPEISKFAAEVAQEIGRFGDDSSGSSAGFLSVCERSLDDDPPRAATTSLSGPLD